MKRLLVALVPLLLVSACGQTEPDPTPVPTTPSVSVSSASPSATSEDELYAEAERVFRRMTEVSARYELRGDFSGFPDEMKSVAMGDFLAASTASYAFMAEKGWSVPDGASPIIRSEPAPSQPYEDSEATLHVCTDSRDVRLQDPNGGAVGTGDLSESMFYFKHDVDGQLKIFLERYREVESCSISG